MTLPKKNQLPNVPPETLPIGLVAIGNDSNLYVVSTVENTKIWSLFKKATISCHTITSNELAIIKEAPSIEYSDAPKINMLQKTVLIESEVDEPPRKRGRPKKQDGIQRITRPPTEYNLFMQSEMLKLKHISDSTTKMKLVAEAWKLRKSSA